jgi:hypothetical protein
MRVFKQLLDRSPISRRSFSVMLVATVLSAATSALALDIGKLITNDPAPPDKFKVIHVVDLEAMIADKNSHVMIYDANGWGLRSRVGIIPGAHLLTSDDKYDVTTTLPPEKSANLVFYCADTL